jgi:hypothetical protein
MSSVSRISKGPFKMSKLIEIGIFVVILVLFLFVMKSAFGAGPDNNDTAYRNELVNYLHSHNMTINNTQLKANELMNINTLDISELQAVVRGHQNDCESGTFSRFAASSNLSDAEISEKFGDC